MKVLRTFLSKLKQKRGTPLKYLLTLTPKEREFRASEPRMSYLLESEDKLLYLLPTTVKQYVELDREWFYGLPEEYRELALKLVEEQMVETYSMDVQVVGEHLTQCGME